MIWVRVRLVAFRENILTLFWNLKGKEEVCGFDVTGSRHSSCLSLWCMSLRESGCRWFLCNVLKAGITLFFLPPAVSSEEGLNAQPVSALGNL